MLKPLIWLNTLNLVQFETIMYDLYVKALYMDKLNVNSVVNTMLVFKLTLRPKQKVK